MMPNLPRLTAAICAVAAALVFAETAGAQTHTHAFYTAGEPGNAREPARAISITMQENSDGSMRYSLQDIVVKQGEQVRFELRNLGKEAHEFILDDPAHNAAHKVIMEKNPQMLHDDPNGKRLAAGASATILWRFSKPGIYEFACLIPGHYEAGMHGKVIVN